MTGGAGSRRGRDPIRFALVGPGLVDGKLRALAELERTAHATSLDEEELGAWLGALESLRLA